MTRLQVDVSPPMNPRHRSAPEERHVYRVDAQTPSGAFGEVIIWRLGYKHGTPSGVKRSWTRIIVWFSSPEMGSSVFLQSPILIEL